MAAMVTRCPRGCRKITGIGGRATIRDGELRGGGSGGGRTGRWLWWRERGVALVVGRHRVANYWFLHTLQVYK